jgi:hypothetical protein
VELFSKQAAFAVMYNPAYERKSSTHESGANQPFPERRLARHMQGQCRPSPDLARRSGALPIRSLLTERALLLSRHKCIYGLTEKQC